jgi:hypothetical protein
LERLQNGFGETKNMMKKIMAEDLALEGELVPAKEDEAELLTMSLMSLNEPTKSTALVDYGLDVFTNSIWENFMGSMVEYKKLTDENGTFTITDKKPQKLGFV